jgi:hypothetical protein
MDYFLFNFSGVQFHYTMSLIDFVWLIGYFRQFLSVAVAMPRMAEFCAVLHQALDVAIVSQKIRKIHI